MNMRLSSLLVNIVIAFTMCACGGGSSSSVQEARNAPPIANAGADQSVATNTVVNLDGSGSTDADGDSLSYQWSLTTVASGSNAALSDGAVASPSFTADLDGTYIAQLIVNDGTVSSATDTVTIVASTGIQPP